ncbi:MAG: molybdenum cofactor biosynthesis protein MoaE [Gemmatimonadota bacterium]|nr:MAG: molybdenum cofactor biosynthesis protein MoaE [Gemmatimonadota bacterium]
MYCLITAEPIDALEIMRRVRSDADGAVVLFAGVVRDHDAGRPVAGLRYEAYEAMAARKLTDICQTALSQFEVSDIAVAHRVGDLAVGEITVAIAVAAPHRDAAYQASREVIGRLKREVPIWKLERYADGEEAWLEGTVIHPSERS